MARATETVAVKIRMREQLRRDIERIAIRNDRSTNAEIVRLLEAAVLADKAGIVGVDGIIKVVKSASAAEFAEEMLLMWQAKIGARTAPSAAPPPERQPEARSGARLVEDAASEHQPEAMKVPLHK
jgi:hypothetical protein